MGVAVSALSGSVTGCVAVEPRPDPVPVTSGVDAPRLSPDQDVYPQIVQAPAREALNAALEPSKEAAPSTAPSKTPPVRRTAPSTPRHAAPATPPARPAPAAAPAPPEPAVQAPRITPSLPDPAAGAAAGTGTDVCGLGEGYGGWRPDSPESRICRQTYGR